jgi:hypothetical protein
MPFSDNPFLAILNKSIEKAPRKLSAYNQYLKMYYEKRVKNEYLRRLSDMRQAFKDATEEERQSGTVEEPIPLKLMNLVGHEIWDLEPDDVRELVAKAAEDSHAKRVEEWEQAMLIPDTAHQIHQ